MERIHVIRTTATSKSENVLICDFYAFEKLTRNREDPARGYSPLDALFRNNFIVFHGKFDRYQPVTSH